MTTTPVLAMAIASLGVAASTGAGVPSLDTPFEPTPCVITLNSTYVMPTGNPTIAIDPSVITCPPSWTSFNAAEAIASMGQTYGWVFFQSSAAPALPSSSERQPSLGTGAVSTYDPATNALVRTPVFLLTLYGPGTWDSVVQSTGSPSYAPYLTDSSDPVNPKYYRLVLAHPFTAVEGVAPTPTCSLTLPTKFTYTWGTGPGFTVPDSAVACTGGVTFTSSSFWINATFDSRSRDQAQIYTTRQGTLNYGTNTFQNDQMWLDNGSLSIGGVISQGAGLGSTGVFGRFRAATQGSWIESKLTGMRYKLALTRPFTVKRKTTVTAKARRGPEGRLRVTISADRNASFQNTGVPLRYRRQTVLPASPQDHAIVRRGTKVLARVELSPYGKAAVNVPDLPGSNAYSVTMVETDDNYQGVARFRG